MDIEEIWKNMPSVSKDGRLAVQVDDPGKLKGKSPLAKISRVLLMNIIYGVIICMGLVVSIFVFDILYVRLAFSAITLFSICITFSGWEIYRGMSAHERRTLPMLQEMEYQYTCITGWIKTQQMVSIFFYPFSISGGFMLGGVMGSGKTVQEFMSKPAAWILLVILILVITPLSYYFANKIMYAIFGKHLDNLKKNIEDLKQAA